MLPWASVLANVEIGLGPQRGSRRAREQAIGTLREVGLEERRADWPAVLSGGQKQRVALARALVSHPQLLAFDEPLGALDALTRITMQRLIERVWLDQRFTAIMVTHDVTEAVTLADRVLIIEDGQIALDLPIDLARPRELGSPELAALEGKNPEGNCSEVSRCRLLLPDTVRASAAAGRHWSSAFSAAAKLNHLAARASDVAFWPKRRPAMSASCLIGLAPRSLISNGRRRHSRLDRPLERISPTMIEIGCFVQA